MSRSGSIASLRQAKPVSKDYQTAPFPPIAGRARRSRRSGRLRLDFCKVQGRRVEREHVSGPLRRFRIKLADQVFEVVRPAVAAMPIAGQTCNLDLSLARIYTRGLITSSRLSSTSKNEDCRHFR
jgi:hypothetical protein